MALLTLENNILKLDPDIINIPELKAIWDRDKSKGKETAYKELSYVFYYIDFKSPYQNYHEAEREKKVIEDYVRIPKWKPDELVRVAVDKYNNLQHTATIRLLKAARIAADKLADYFKDSEPEDRNYTSNLEKLGKIVESLDKLEQRVKSEQSTQDRIRGGGQARAREK